MGQPVAYRLCPGERPRPFALPGASRLETGGIPDHHLWVTPFDPKERFPAGDYPNQNPGGDGLPRWTAADRTSRTATSSSGTPSAKLTSRVWKTGR